MRLIFAYLHAVALLARDEGWRFASLVLAAGPLTTGVHTATRDATRALRTFRLSASGPARSLARGLTCLQVGRWRASTDLPGTMYLRPPFESTELFHNFSFTFL